MPDKNFWDGQRVLLTGHTGFKGSWTALWLSQMGAEVLGYALVPETKPALFDLLSPVPGLNSVVGDIRDPAPLNSAVADFSPTLAIHMAAQPLVRRSYREPVETYGVNVMGTAHVLEALRRVQGLKAALVITTDKVYRNDDSGRAFREVDPLGGHDPYSSSKAACEEVVSSWRQSYFESLGIPLATARAGNVVGGGDWSEDRLVPDIWRAMVEGKSVILRNPESVRPWQHVLDPVSGYLTYVEALASGRRDLPHTLNFAPAADSPMTVREVTETLGAGLGIEKPWQLAEGAQPVEMKLLTLDASLAAHTIGWRPLLTGRQAIEWSAEWYLARHRGEDVKAKTVAQIQRYEALADTAATT
ncbi:MAG: CDP-glucose 4,6-dehydratase [Cypionkella sp.]|uniref:CDP-glucose 4,6-dehydratase n=1 Tax=Cypionkella sp. TaxID=2811411 RepID=UPI002ABC85CE|nr:CDP-glucose 4,6-dehydratase [Cypionkella sp.]MDZ4309652.1 CDP-glucose 4,6-dehydratase [Cypionkella sp.]